jgi:hypothetical protein
MLSCFFICHVNHTTNTAKMNEKKYFLDLSSLSQEERVNLLCDLLVNKSDMISFNLSSDPEETMTMAGKHARGFAFAGAFNCEPLIPWKVNTPKVILEFLSSKLKQTNQTIFPRYPGEGYTQTEYDRVSTTDQYDWASMIIAIRKKDPACIEIDVRQSSLMTEVTILRVENESFNVRVDAMGLSPHDKELVDCQNAVLRVYRAKFA